MRRILFNHSRSATKPGIGLPPDSTGGNVFGTFPYIYKHTHTHTHAHAHTHIPVRIMAPNEHGSCKACQTLNFDCVCEDFQAKKRLKRAASDRAYEDAVCQAQIQDDQFGVLWNEFLHETPTIEELRMCASQILEAEKPLSFYIGLCKAPSLRFYEEPDPHCMRYTKMYVLSVGENMNI